MSNIKCVLRFHVFKSHLLKRKHLKLESSLSPAGFIVFVLKSSTMFFDWVVLVDCTLWLEELNMFQSKGVRSGWRAMVCLPCFLCRRLFCFLICLNVLFVCPMQAQAQGHVSMKYWGCVDEADELLSSVLMSFVIHIGDVVLLCWYWVEVELVGDH